MTLRRGTASTVRLACLGLAAVVLASCGHTDMAVQGPWQKMAPSPLASRWHATGVWTGSEMLVLGGLGRADRFAGMSSEAYARDVAAYDPVRDSWRMLAPTPIAFTRPSAVVLGRTVYVLNKRMVSRASLHAYDLDTDTWRRLAPPPSGKRVGPLGLVAAGSKLYAYQEAPQPDLLYDPATGRWADVPANPFGHDLRGSVLGLPDSRVVEVGVNLTKPVADGRRSYDAAVFDPRTRTWKRMPRSPYLEGSNTDWAVAGGRVVNLDPETHPGVRSGFRVFPAGAQLDVGSRTWSGLPDRPDRAGALGWATAYGGDVALLQGWALDVPAGRWTRLPEIPDAAAGLSFPALAWTGNSLIVWGGRGDSSPRLADHGEFPTDQGWVWVRPTGAARG